VWQPRGHSGIVNRIAFGPDSRMILTSSNNDDMSLIYDCKVCASAPELLELARNKTSRELTASERQTYVR
jgi:hypothetical protein